MKVGITGAEGLVGWHLSCYLHQISGVQLIRADRSTFATSSALETFVNGCDVIVHLAGMNRGDEKLVAETNIELARRLIDACESRQDKDRRIHILFSSSTHIHKGTAYGESKKRCSELFSQWASRTGSLFANLILPHVFGEAGRPFYNSVVSTFCHQVANQMETKGNDSPLELVHTHRVSQYIHDIIRNKRCGDLPLSGHKISVLEVLDRIKEFDGFYRQGTVSAVDDSFDLSLFNTYRSYLYPQYYPVSSPTRREPWGYHFLFPTNLIKGQTTILSIEAGLTLGNSFSFTRLDRFCVLSGQATFKIRKVYGDEVKTFILSGSDAQYIDMPTLHTHKVTNTGEGNLIILSWSNDMGPLDAGTYSQAVETLNNV